VTFATIETGHRQCCSHGNDEEISGVLRGQCGRFMDEEQVVLEVRPLSRSDFFDQVEG